MPFEFVLFFSKKSATYSFKCCYSSTRCAVAKQRITTPTFLVFEVERIDSNDIYQMLQIIWNKKIGLKSLFWQYSVNSKKEKNRLIILVDPWPVTAWNTNEHTFITFLNKVSICCDLENYSVHVQLTQRVWIWKSTLLSSHIVTLRDKMVWQEGKWLRNVVKRRRIVLFLFFVYHYFFSSLCQIPLLFRL